MIGLPAAVKRIIRGSVKDTNGEFTARFAGGGIDFNVHSAESSQEPTALV